MANEQELTDEELAEKVQAILDSSLEEGDKIRQLHDLGYSNTQIHQEFGFKKSTVYRVCPVRPAKQGGNDRSLEPKGKFELMKMGQKDMIPPEQALQGIRLQDGDYKLGFIDGMGTLIMAARYNQILAASQAEIVTRQLELWRESRESSKDIAREAAQQAVVGVANIIERSIPKGEPPKDIQQMFTKRIDRMWDLMEYMQTQRMFPGYQAGKPPEGWTVEKLPASGSPPPGPQAGQGQGLPQGWTEESAEGGKQ